MDIANSPKAIISNDGRFLAVNIPPGEYVLVLWTPVEARFVPDPTNTANELIVTVISNQIIDIGTVQAPPLP
jgi:hypothetical protein